MFTKETLAYLDVFQLLGLCFLIAAVVMSIIVLTGLVKIRLNRIKMKGILLLAFFQPLVYFVCESIVREQRGKALHERYSFKSVNGNKNKKLEKRTGFSGFYLMFLVLDS